MKVPFTGGCLCGEIRYEVIVAPENEIYCHCSDCRRASGTANHPGIGVPNEGFRLTRGEPKIFTVKADSGRDLPRAFCGTCGTGLYSILNRRPSVSIKAGTLDEPSQFRPDIEIWTSSKVEWADLPGDLKSYPEGLTD